MLSWCLFALFFASSATAWAQEARVLVVRSRDAAAGDRVADALVHGLAARGVEVRRPLALPSPPADDSVERARDAYYALHPEEARGLLEAWLVRADQTGGADTSREALLEALLWLALTRLALSDAAGADAALARALAIEPALALDPIRYPPTLRDRLDALRSIPPPHATLLVDTEPPGARVWMNGAIAGEAPLRVELPVGVHLVRASVAGHRPEGRAVELGPEGASLLLRPPLDPERALVEAGPPGTPLPRATQAAAQASGEHLVVLDVTRAPHGLRAVLVDEGADRRAAAGPMRSPVELASSLLAAWDLAANASLPGSSAPDPWPWVGVGVGAAVLAGAAVAIGVALGTQPSGFSAVGTRR